MKCKLCGGECEKMGVFGLLEHWLCRNCGMWWNRSLSKAKKKKVFKTEKMKNNP